MVREEEVLLSDPETLLEEVEDEDEDDDGPPPGFDSIAINSKLEKMVVEDCGGEEDEDDGPPPGFSEPHPPQVLPPPPPPISHSVSDTRMLRNQELPDVQIGRKQYEDRPPMGWHSAGSKQPHTCMRASSGLFSDIQMAKNQRIDDGPPQPPGWQLNPQQQRPPESTPLLVPQSAPSSNIQTGVTQEDDDGPPPGWQLISSQQKPPLLPQSLAPSAIVDTEKRIKVGSIGETERQLSSTDCSCTPEHPSKAAPPLCSSSSVGSSDIEMASKPRSIKNEDKRLRTDKGPMQPLAAQLPPSLVPTSSEVGQLVCGTCRQLLSYPQGSKWVQCSACRTVNLVLEAHEVGQVKCGGCTVLLMYPYGAPSVKCSSCHFTTRIGAHNRRPHLAAQQARRLRHPPHQRR